MREQIASDIRGWDAIRDHRTGTEGDAATAAWLASLVGAAGVEPHIDAFPFARRVPHDCSVAVEGPAGSNGGRPARCSTAGSRMRPG